MSFSDLTLLRVHDLSRTRALGGFTPVKGLLVILFSRQELVDELNHTRPARNIAQADRCRIGLPVHASFVAYDLAFLYLAGLGERVT